MRKLTDVQLTFTVSPDLDIAGFQELSSEIAESHPLYTQFMESLSRINVSIPNTGLQGISKKELQKQVGEFYFVHAKDIEAHCEQTRGYWNQYGNQFLGTCDEMFSRRAFAEVVEFTVYPSLWRVYIQQMKHSAISFPLAGDVHDPDEALYVVLHELLHAFFYQYVSTIPNLRNREDLWDIAEIFNSIVMNQDRFKKFYPSHTIASYPMHDKIIKEITASGIGDNDSAELTITQISNHLKLRGQI